MIKGGYAYILASKKNGTLYLGVTSDLVKRIYEHKKKINKGFTEKYNITILVWYEACDDIESVISREKNIKNWKREWKIQLIEEMNPEWGDLYNRLLL